MPGCWNARPGRNRRGVPCATRFEPLSILAATLVLGGCVGYGYPGDYGNGYGNNGYGNPYGNPQPYPGATGQVFRCESQDNRTRRCNVDTRYGIRINRQLSGSPCIQGRSFRGYDNAGVWVSNGCRAGVRDRRRLRPGRPAISRQWLRAGQAVRCESQDNRMRRCNVAVYRGVQMAFVGFPAHPGLDLGLGSQRHLGRPRLPRGLPRLLTRFAALKPGGMDAARRGAPLRPHPPDPLDRRSAGTARPAQAAVRGRIRVARTATKSLRRSATWSSAARRRSAFPRHGAWCWSRAGRGRTAPGPRSSCSRRWTGSTRRDRPRSTWPGRWRGCEPRWRTPAPTARGAGTRGARDRNRGPRRQPRDGAGRRRAHRARQRRVTHCNTGSLATAGFGTALGVIRAGVAAGRAARVFAGETRPWNQGRA